MGTAFLCRLMRKTDGMTSLKNRAEDSKHGLGKDAFNPKKTSKDQTVKLACEKWFDVRAFGQVFAFGKGEDASGVSVPIRGPVTLQSAFSVEPVSVMRYRLLKASAVKVMGVREAQIPWA